MSGDQDNLHIRGGSLIVIAALIVIVAGLKASQDLMVPFLLSVFIATIAATPMFWMQRRGVPESLSLPLVMILMVLTIGLLGALIAQSTQAFGVKLPEYQQRLLVLQKESLELLRPILEPLNITDLSTITTNFSPNSALELAGTTLARLGGVLSNSFLIILTVIFILAEAASFPKKLNSVLADPTTSLPHFSRFAENVNRYIAIKTSVSVATGLTVTIFLWILGVDFPILWGLLAFLLNYVPTIGSIIAAVPPMLLALVQFGPGAAAGVGIGFLMINIIMGNWVEPKFMGKGLGLSTLVVFLSLVVWGWVLGPVGMLLSVPLTMTAKIALEANPSTHWIAVLLGPADAVEDDPEEANEEAIEETDTADQDPRTDTNG